MSSLPDKQSIFRQYQARVLASSFGGVKQLIYKRFSDVGRHSGNTHGTSTLLLLPTEIHRAIGEALVGPSTQPVQTDPDDEPIKGCYGNIGLDGLNAFLRTCKYLHELLNPQLYILGVAHENPMRRTGYHEAVFNGNVPAVTKFLWYGADPNDVPAGNEWGESVLSEAAFYNRCCVVKILLLAGADINHGKHCQALALHAVASQLWWTRRNSRGAIRTVQLLLARGADVAIKDEEMCNVLHNMAIYGFRPGFKYEQEVIFCLLMSLCPELLEMRNAAGETPLQCAQHYGATECFLRYGADVNAHNGNGETALYKAVSRDKRSQVKVLLKHGARIDIPMPGLRTSVLHMALHRHDHEICRMLIKKAGQNDLVHTRDLEQFTVLQYGAKSTRAKTFKLLLDHSTLADVNQLRAGHTNSGILHSAAMNITHGDKIIQMLLKRGAYIDAVNSLGHTALHYAARCGNLKSTKILISHGANQGIRTHRRQTALHLAVCEPYPRINILELLLDHGVNDVNEQDDLGCTVLHYIAVVMNSNVMTRSLQALQLLVDRGANKQIRDNHHGKTALQMAKTRGYYDEVLKILGPDKNNNDKAVDYR